MAGIAARGDWSRWRARTRASTSCSSPTPSTPLLQQVWSDLHMRVRQIMALRNLQNDDSMEVFYRHVPIVDAIEAGDVDAAVRRSRRTSPRRRTSCSTTQTRLRQRDRLSGR
jgi:DNA-binding GntR family transcriptional regulator